MCLAEPIKVIGKDGTDAKVNINGRIRVVDASLIPRLRVGDYILLHDKLAIQKLDKKDAEETLRIVKEVGT